MTLGRKPFSVCYSIVPSPPIRAVISRMRWAVPAPSGMTTRPQFLQVKVSWKTIVKAGALFLTVSQKPLHEGPERVDELFIRKLCLMFQLPDTEIMEKFSKKLQIVQE